MLANGTHVKVIAYGQDEPDTADLESNKQWVGRTGKVHHTDLYIAVDLDPVEGVYPLLRFLPCLRSELEVLSYPSGDVNATPAD